MLHYVNHHPYKFISSLCHQALNRNPQTGPHDLALDDCPAENFTQSYLLRMATRRQYIIYPIFYLHFIRRAVY